MRSLPDLRRNETKAPLCEASTNSIPCEGWVDVPGAGLGDGPGAGLGDGPGAGRYDGPGAGLGDGPALHTASSSVFKSSIGGGVRSQNKNFTYSML